MIHPSPDYQTPQRMAAKLKAVPLPDLSGKCVLDIGCDFAAWSFLAAEQGARDVLGLDRNRFVNGYGPHDLIAMNRHHASAHDSRMACRFEQFELGRQWKEFGRFDVILMLSVYHHVFQCAGGDHVPIWYWLRRHIADDGVLLWEGPVDDSDPVVRANVSAVVRPRLNRDAILKAASIYFEAEHIGPALHEPTREVWRFTPRETVSRFYTGDTRDGAGGATAAFNYENGRRIREIDNAIGMMPLPGSLNLVGDRPFWWHRDYYRAQILDVARRDLGLTSEWLPRWARFFPLQADGIPAFAFRFEGESYEDNFVELIAATRLRDIMMTSARLAA